MKTFDLAFDVDPLFHKMAQTFDEGGAKGMLLVNLPLHNGCHIMFDSSEAYMNNEVGTEENNKNDDYLIDIQSLTRKINSLAPDITALDICPKLQYLYDRIQECAGVSRMPSLSMEDEANLQVSDYDDGCEAEFTGDDFGAEAEHLEQQLESTHNTEDSMDMDMDECPETAPVEWPLQKNEVPVCGSSCADNYFNEIEIMLRDDIGEGNDYSFLSKECMANWAGPEHWKCQGLKRKPTHESLDVKKSLSRRSKAEYVDFSLKVPASTFQKSKLKSATILSANVLRRQEENADSLVLPIDEHYSLEHVLSLFTKPRLSFNLKSRGGEQQVHFLNEENNGASDCEYQSGGGDDDSFYNDGYEIAGLIDNVKTVENIHIKYEKLAKRVDVRNLKESIWGHLTEARTPVEDNEGEPNEASVEFNDMVEKVAEKMPQDVTVPFYFICTLHLANEKGLELCGKDDLSGFTIIRKDEH